MLDFFQRFHGDFPSDFVFFERFYVDFLLDFMFF